MNLLKNLIIISFMTIIVKIFGFIKDVVLASNFGANTLTDCFFNSFKLINLFRKILAEGVFCQLFIPTLIEYKKKNSKNNLFIFIKKILGFLILLTFAVSLVCLIFSKQFIILMNPGFKNYYKINKTSELFIILLPYILISSFISFTNSILSIYNLFTFSSISPIILNISTIILLYYNFFKISIIILPISILIGGLIQSIIHIIYIKKKININFIPIIDYKDNDIKKFNRSTISIISNSLINQLSVIFNSILSSFLDSGSVSWIYYSDKIMEFPSGILGVSLSTVIFPVLSKNYNNIYEYSNILDWSIKIGLIFSIPILIIMLLLSKYIVILLFYYGNFSYFDVKMTKNSLIAYSLGIIGVVLSKIFTSAFNANKDNITPLKISIVTMFLTQIMNFILVYMYKHVGLSLSISLNYILYSIFLIIYLIKKKIYKTNYNWFSLFKKISVSILTMSIFLLFSMKYVNITYFDTFINRLFKLSSLIIFSIFIYSISLYISGINKKDFIFYQ